MAYDFFINLGYLVGAVGFVWGLRLLSSPDTARRGNILAGIGMGLAILSAMLAPMAGASNNYGWILGGMVGGDAHRNGRIVAGIDEWGAGQYLEIAASAGRCGRVEQGEEVGIVRVGGVGDAVEVACAAGV